MVSEKLLSLINTSNPEAGKFITCIHRLQLNYPPIVDRYLSLQIYFSIILGAITHFLGYSFNG